MFAKVKTYSVCLVIYALVSSYTIHCEWKHDGVVLGVS